MFCGTLDPTSNRADWDLTISFVDSDTDEPIDLAGASITVELRDRLSGVSGLVLSTASGGISITDTGTFNIHAAAADMRMLRADTYEVGGIYELNLATKQFAIGLLPVIDGVVT